MDNLLPKTDGLLAGLPEPMKMPSAENWTMDNQLARLLAAALGSSNYGKNPQQYTARNFRTDMSGNDMWIKKFGALSRLNPYDGEKERYLKEQGQAYARRLARR